MKAKTKKHRITMIMLREADKPVRRSRFTRTSLYTVLLFIVFVIATITGWQVALHKHSANTIESLSVQITEHDAEYDEMVSSKETIIEDLKSNIVSLTEKTAKLKSRYEELEVLKDEVMDLLDEVEESGTTAAATKESVITILSDATSSIGGEMAEPSPEQWEQFVNDSYSAIDALEDDMAAVSEQLDLAKAGLEDLIHQFKTTPNYWPTISGVVTSGFGVRSDPFTGRAAFHSGIDIAGSLYDPVYAAADGVVSETGWDNAKGYYVIIRHRSNLKTQYMHLSAVDVSKNDSVTKGERIASLGSTGRSTGPHLHFEIIISGKEMNPNDYFKN